MANNFWTEVRNKYNIQPVGAQLASDAPGGFWQEVKSRYFAQTPVQPGAQAAPAPGVPGAQAAPVPMQAAQGQQQPDEIDIEGRFAAEISGAPEKERIGRLYDFMRRHALAAGADTDEKIAAKRKSLALNVAKRAIPGLDVKSVPFDEMVQIAKRGGQLVDPIAAGFLDAPDAETKRMYDMAKAVLKTKYSRGFWTTDATERPRILELGEAEGRDLGPLMERLKGDFDKYTPEQRQKFLSIASGVASTIMKPVEGHKLTESALRSVQQAEANFRSSVEQWVGAEGADYTEFIRQLQAIAAGGSPVQPYATGALGELEQGMYDTAGMAPTVGLSMATTGGTASGLTALGKTALAGKVGTMLGRLGTAGKVAGAVGKWTAANAPAAAFWTTQTMPDLNADLVRAGVPAEQALPLATVGGAVIGALEMIVPDFGLKGPKIKAIMPGLRKRMAEYMVQSGLLFGKEWSEEALQAGAEEATKRVAASMSDAKFDWAAEKEKGIEQVYRAAIPLMVMQAPHILARGGQQATLGMREDAVARAQAKLAPILKARGKLLETMTPELRADLLGDDPQKVAAAFEKLPSEVRNALASNDPWTLSSTAANYKPGQIGAASETPQTAPEATATEEAPLATPAAKAIPAPATGPTEAISDTVSEEATKQPAVPPPFAKLIAQTHGSLDSGDAKADTYYRRRGQEILDTLREFAQSSGMSEEDVSTLYDNGFSAKQLDKLGSPVVLTKLAKAGITSDEVRQWGMDGAEAIADLRISESSKPASEVTPSPKVPVAETQSAEQTAEPTPQSSEKSDVSPVATGGEAEAAKPYKDRVADLHKVLVTVARSRGARDKAKDIAQDVVLHFLGKEAEYAGYSDNHLRQAAVKAAKNAVVSSQRTVGREQPLPEGQEPEAPSEPAVPETFTEEELDEKQPPQLREIWRQWNLGKKPPKSPKKMRQDILAAQGVVEQTIGKPAVAGETKEPAGWFDSEEGPFDSKAKAQEYVNAEFGVPTKLVHKADGWHVYTEDLDAVEDRILPPLPSEPGMAEEFEAIVEMVGRSAAGKRGALEQSAEDEILKAAETYGLTSEHAKQAIERANRVRAAVAKGFRIADEPQPEAAGEAVTGRQPQPWSGKAPVVDDVWRKNTSRYLREGEEPTGLSDVRQVPIDSVVSPEHDYASPSILESMKSNPESLPPIIVEEMPGGKLEIADGGGRYAAAKQLGMTTVPVRVVSYKEQPQPTIGKQAETTPPKSVVRKEQAAPTDKAEVVAAIRKLQGQGGRVRLAELRAELKGWTPQEVDDALRAMNRSGEVFLYHGDKPQELTDEDRAAAWKTEGGEERHFVALGTPSAAEAVSAPPAPTPEQGAKPLTKRQQYSIATMLATNTLDATIRRLSDSFVLSRYQAVEFAKTIDKWYKKRDGFIPKRVNDFINGDQGAAHAKMLAAEEQELASRPSAPGAVSAPPAQTEPKSVGEQPWKAAADSIRKFHADIDSAEHGTIDNAIKAMRKMPVPDARALAAELGMTTYGKAPRKKILEDIAAGLHERKTDASRPAPGGGPSDAQRRAAAKQAPAPSAVRGYVVRKGFGVFHYDNKAEAEAQADHLNGRLIAVKEDGTEETLREEQPAPAPSIGKQGPKAEAKGEAGQQATGSVGFPAGEVSSHGQTAKSSNAKQSKATRVHSAPEGSGTISSRDGGNQGEAAIRQQAPPQSRPPESVRDFVRQAQEAGWSAEESTAAAHLIEANAEYLGISADEWVQTNISAVTRSHEVLGDLFQRAVEAQGINQEQIEKYIARHYGTAYVDDYTDEVLRFINRASNAPSGKSALRGNQKTLLSVDISGDCPMRANGTPCIFCYVEQPRSAVEAFKKTHKLAGDTIDELRSSAHDKGLKLPVMQSPVKVFDVAKYSGEILKMPKPLVRFFNERVGGLRVYSNGDYRQVDKETLNQIVRDASKVGLKLKFITKQIEAVRLLRGRQHVFVNLSTEMMVENADVLAKGNKALEAVFSDPAARKMIAYGFSVDEATKLRGRHPRMAVRYVALNREDGIRAIADPRVDVVTMYHGVTDPEKLKAIWRIQNPYLFDTLGAKTVDALARVFQYSKNVKGIATTVTQAELDRVLGPKSMPVKQFTELGIKKLCCQTGKCSTCGACCGFGRGRGDRVLSQMLDGKPLASVEFDEAGKAIIRAFDGANVSSLVHELGHIFRRTLRQDDLAVAEKFTGVEPNERWSIDAEEKFARAFERYLRDGKAPTNSLISVFQKFRDWLRKIYTRIAGSEVNIRISPEMRKVFDRMLGAPNVKSPAAKQGEGKPPKPAAGGETEAGDSGDYAAALWDLWGMGALRDQIKAAKGEKKKQLQKQFDTLDRQRKEEVAKRAAAGETEAERLQREADESKPRGNTYGSIAGGGEMILETTPVPDNDLPLAINAGRPPEVTRRATKAHGMQKEGLWQRIKDLAWLGLHDATRAQEHLPKDAEHAADNEFFRLLKNVGPMSQDEAIRRVGSVVANLTPNQLKVFEWALIVENQLAALQMGQPLRFGFESLEQVEAERDRMRALVSRVPAVAKAIEARQAVVQETVEKLVEQKLLPETALNNVQTYYHQQVHFYALRNSMTPTGAGRVGRKKRAFQKSRVEGDVLPEEMDYNTSYIEAETAWMTDALVELNKKRLFDALMRLRDEKAANKQSAKSWNFETLVGGPENVNRIEQLRGMIAESNASEDKNDSAERMQRKVWIEELQDLDPTYPYRVQIAKMAAILRKDLGIEADEEYDMTDDEMDAEWFRIVKEQADAGNPAALGFFKAIGERNAFIKEQLGSKFKTWQDVAEESGNVVWTAPEGNLFYRAFTIPERIIEQLVANATAEIPISKDDLRQVLAMGGPRAQYSIPPELAAQLDETRKVIPAHGWGKVADWLNSAWKIWTLLNPKRFIPYNVRNMLGDTEVTVAGIPGAVEMIGRSMEELRKYNRGFLSLSPDLRSARDLNVIGSGFAAEEVPGLKDVVIFRRFFDTLRGKRTITQRLGAAGTDYFDAAKRYTEFRENLLRYSTYLYYLDRIRRGVPFHYGGARREVVDRLIQEMGPEVAAAHLSRNLIGDYGDRTVLGNWLRRRLLPFWAFQEINIFRYPRMAINAWQAGDRYRAAGTLSVGAAKMLLTSRLAWMYGAVWMWNNFGAPMLIPGAGGDDDEDQPPYDRANLNIMLGRNPDGSLRRFRNVSTLGDFLEWFGINEAAVLYEKLASGQITGKELAKEMASSPLEKVFSSLRPEVGLGTQGIFGLSGFPEPTAPRSVRKDEAIPNALGLVDEYKWMKGKLLEDGTTLRKYYWQRWLIGVSDPRQDALSSIYEARSDFMVQQGKQEKGIFPISRYKEARDAFTNEDQEAFINWKDKFKREFGDKSRGKFIDFVRNLDPLAKKLSDGEEMKFINDFLTSEQREKLRVARDYAANMRDTLLTWWDDTEPPVKGKRGFTTTVRDQVIGGVAFRATSMPSDDDVAEAAKDTGYPKEKAREMLVQQAEDELASLGYTYPEAVKALQRYWIDHYGSIYSQQPGHEGELKETYTQHVGRLAALMNKAAQEKKGFK